MSYKSRTSCWGEYTLLVLVTLLAAGLRIYKLGEWSVFIDEFRTWESAVDPSLDRFFHPNSHLVFWLMTKMSLATFGESLVSLRLVPAVFGIVTVPLIYVSMRNLFDKYVGFIAALIVAVSPWHIYMSQMARWYTLFVLVSFFALMSFYAFMEFGKARYFVFYAALSYLAVTLHLTGFFLPMIATGYLALLLLLPEFRTEAQTSKKLLIILLVHVALSLAFVPKFVEFIQAWRGIEELVGSWGGGLSDISMKVVYHTTPSVVVGAGMGVLLLLGVRDRRGLFLALYCIVPFTVLSLFAVFGANVSARYQFFTLPAMAVAAGYMLVHLRALLARKSEWVFASMVIIIIVPSLQTDYLYFTSEYGYRQRSREAFQYIKKRIEKDDQLFLAGVYPTYEQTFYAKSLIRLEKMGITEERLNTSSLPETLDLQKRTWVITRGRAPENPEGFRKWVAENTRLLAEFPTRRGAQDQTLKVHLYSPPSSWEPGGSQAGEVGGRG